MFRRLLSLTLLAWAPLLVPAGRAENLPEDRSNVLQVAVPAAPNATDPILQRSIDGRIWLAWLQPVEGARFELRLAEYDRGHHLWNPSHLIAADPAFAAGRSAGPALAAAGGGKLAAAWVENTGGRLHLVATESTDGGASWSAPAPVASAGPGVSRPTLATLADGRFAVAWTETLRTERDTQAQVRTELLDEPSAARATFPLAPGPGAPTALAPFPDGSALLALAGAATDAPQLNAARLRRGAWSLPRPIAPSRASTAPASTTSVAPSLASDGGQVAVAWITGTGAEARLWASSSPDAGERFLAPQRIDAGSPLGTPAVVLLHDGALLIFWLAAPASEEPVRLWSRRMTPDATLDAPILIASLPAAAVGSPSVALVDDYAGGNLAAHLLVAYASPHHRELSLHTLRVTVPEASLVAARDDCHCAPSPLELAGFPIRGTITAATAGRGTLTVLHPEFPGLLQEGSDEFRATPELIAAVQPRTPIFARIVQHEGAWWIFGVRLLQRTP